MHHAEADELGVLEARDQRQHARLLAPFQLRLEADQAEVVAGEVVLAQLHRRVGRTPGARVDQADRLHRAEAQRVASAVRHHFNRQAPFEELLLVEVMNGCRFGGDDRVVEAVVLLLRHRAVQVITLAIIDATRRTRRARATIVSAEAASPSRCAKDPGRVDRLGQDDRTDGVVEVEVVGADEGGDVRRQRFRCQRPGGDDQREHRRVGRNPRDFLAHDGDQRVAVNRVGDRLREAVAIDRQRGARGDAMLVRGAHDQGSEPAHLLLQETDGVIELVAAEGVRADQLGEPIGLVHLGGSHRAHLVDDGRYARCCTLPRGL